MTNTLSINQVNALYWIVQRIQAGAPLVALRGLAGTGKTTLIPILRDLLVTDPLQLTKIGTPTHRAAMVLQHKGVTDAATVHSLCLKPIFTPEYTAAIAWLGGHLE